MNIKALQTKYLIIDWEIYTEGTRKYWKIIRVGNHTKVHHFFDNMLKAFDRDDLVMLWSLVKEKFNSTEPTDDKERDIWDGIDIYMLVEKEYPLSRGTLTLKLVVKLLVDKDNEMSRELLKKIFMQDVYFVKELQFNLFSVLHMCDKKNIVLFTDTGCFVLSPDFKLADKSQVLLKVSRKNNMYIVDMKNVVPKESLTCLVSKATLDESMLWHRRLADEKVQKKNDVKARINANTQVSPASTPVSIASTQISTANLSDATVYAFLVSQLNGSQLVHEDLEQIHEDDLEEMDLKWQLALLSMRTRRFF
ncbi:hypothetical protein Tco_0231956 [Tanacetum coccineum]